MIGVIRHFRLSSSVLQTIGLLSLQFDVNSISITALLRRSGEDFEKKTSLPISGVFGVGNDCPGWESNPEPRAQRAELSCEPYNCCERSWQPWEDERGCRDRPAPEDVARAQKQPSTVTHRSTSSID